MYTSKRKNNVKEVHRDKENTYIERTHSIYTSKRKNNVNMRSMKINSSWSFSPSSGISCVCVNT